MLQQLRFPFLFIISVGLMATFPFHQANAQSPVFIQDKAFEEDAKQAIDSLYNRNPEAAREVLSEWIKEYPDHPIWILWDGMELWWEILTDLHNTEFDEHFFNVMKRADYEAGQLLKQHSDHPDALIIRAIANGFTARHHSNREDWLTAANYGRKAYQAYSRLMEVEPGLPDNAFAEGMKQYYAAYIPENYPAVRAVSWFLPDGDKEGGLSKLKEASENGVFARPESIYFLGNILLNYEEEYEEALTYFLELLDRYPNNSYFMQLYVRTLAQLNRHQEVIAYTSEHEESGSLESNFILQEEMYYQRGIALYRMGDHQDALDDFLRAFEIGYELPNTSKRPVYIFSAYYIGRVNEHLDKTEQAAEYYQRVVDSDAGRAMKNRAKDRLKAIQ